MIEVTGDNPTALLVWQKELKYMPEGPRENIVLTILDQTARDHLQMAANSALELGFDPTPDNAASAARSVTVRNPSGEPIEGAAVFLIARNGLFRGDVTNQIGQAAFTSFPFSPVTVFIAAERYRAFIEDLKELTQEVALDMDENIIGSFVATSGWTSIPTIDGELNFILDAQGRRYVYGNSVAINGGVRQPVAVALGARLSLESRDGSKVTILPRAFCGACLLLDIERPCPRSQVVG